VQLRGEQGRSHRLTKSCAREFASRGITVNAIAPGFIQTAMTDKLSAEQKDAITKQIPLASLGQAEDVAEAALFFASRRRVILPVKFSRGRRDGDVINLNFVLNPRFGSD